MRPVDHPVQALSVTAYTLTNALGHGRQAILAALQNGRSGLRPNDYLAALPTWIGRVDGVEKVQLPSALNAYDCRNHRLTQLTLEQDGFAAAVAAAARRYGNHRIGVFLGTSTSGIEETELRYDRLDGETGAPPADYRYDTTHRLGALAVFVQGLLGLTGVSQVTSTACSSSAKAFASAYRYLAVGLCDAAVVGGVDSLCRTTLLGFNALQLVSEVPCRPWDIERSGISIGEAAGFALLERPERSQSNLQFVGYGESSDAYHMSSPHPEGEGGVLAMRRALQTAKISADAIDYLNLHGTATPANDAAEDRAVLTVFGSRVPCSSTKGATGHTLGGAGITEALIACLSLTYGFVPGTTNTAVLDAALRSNVLLQPQEMPLGIAMSNSLGFGGSNASLIFRRNT
jgi:3-oxoacyl-[acyl-carrier-protein] synthase-1